MLYVIVMTEDSGDVHDVFGVFPTERAALDFAGEAADAHERDPAPAKSRFRWHVTPLSGTEPYWGGS